MQTQFSPRYGEASFAQLQQVSLYYWLIQFIINANFIQTQMFTKLELKALGMIYFHWMSIKIARFGNENGNLLALFDRRLVAAQRDHIFSSFVSLFISISNSFNSAASLLIYTQVDDSFSLFIEQLWHDLWQMHFLYYLFKSFFRKVF